jgi:hypothetical protein
VPEISAPAKIPRSARNDNGENISALQLNFLFFCKKLSYKALIPFIGVSALPLKVCHKKQEKFHPILETIDGKEPQPG